MADPISRKLRGFGAKIGAPPELLLNWVGPRVDSKETQGLFSKAAGAKGYLLIWTDGSGSDGSDAFRFGRSDLNAVDRTVRSKRWIGWSDLHGESGPLDLDLTARVEGVHDLISHIDLGLGG
jgi:hypothetical protein